MSKHSSTKAIVYALAANSAIASAKTVAALWTGSGSMMTEAIHSFADCGNQILLFVGMRRAAMPANEKHPMGYGRESYVWSMMVALVLFFLGGVFSVYEGWERYTHPKNVEHADIAVGILLFALILELFSLRGAISTLKSDGDNDHRSLWRWFRETHSSELMVVIGEDIAAIAGLGVALVSTSLVLLTGDVMYDAIGSALIGLLLITVSYLIVSEVHSLLLGEADIGIRNDIQSLLDHYKATVRPLNVFAINHGDSVKIAIKAELPGAMSVDEASAIMNVIEQEIQTRHPRVKWVFFDIESQQRSSATE
jgi:cation diffusion facilitator family transporter